MHPLYFDYNATTPVLPRVFETMVPYLTEKFGNPGCGHMWGLIARNAMDEARDKVARLIGCGPEAVIFTSCATESNNMALRGVFQDASQGCLVVSQIEHPAVLEPARELARQGIHVVQVPVDAHGVLDLDFLEHALAEAPPHGPKMLSLMLANNETGVLQPVAEAARRAHDRGFVVHTDAAQAVGKIPVSVQELGVDMLTIAGHKCYAPKGVGALYVNPVLPLTPLLYGGGQEGGLRSGTENVAFMVALGEACTLAAEEGDTGLEAETRRQQKLGDILYKGLKELGVEVLLHGKNAPRLPNTMAVGFKGLRAGDILSGMVGQDIAASAGAACHAGSDEDVEISHVLQAMRVPEEYAKGTIRFSWGRGTSQEDVHELLERLRPVLHPLSVL